MNMSSLEIYDFSEVAFKYVSVSGTIIEYIEI